MKTKAGGPGRSTLHGSPPEGTYGPPLPPPKAKAMAPEHQAAVTAALNFAQNAFQPPPPPPKAKAMAPEHQAAVTAALNFAQNAFQPPPPPPQAKAPEPKPVLTAALNFAQHAFQPPPPPPPKAKALAPEHQAAVTAALNFARNAFQPPSPPPPQAKAPEPKRAPAFFQSALTVARNVAQAVSPPAPAPSSGDWGPVDINRDGTFTLPRIGTFPLPARGEKKTIPLQGDNFFKIRQRPDGAYEGKFGTNSQPAKPQPQASEPKRAPAFFQSALTVARNVAQAVSPPAPAPSNGDWGPVDINRDGTFTLPRIGTFPLPARGEKKTIPLQGDNFFKIRQRPDGAYEGKFGTNSPSLPARLEDRKKDAGGWPQILVSPDGMIRVPGIDQPLYRPKPGQTDSVPFDAKTTFRFRQGDDGNVYGIFETKAPSPPPPGWTRVNVDRDGMIRLPNNSQSFYPPQPGKTESIQVDARTTLTLRHAEDGEIHGLVETKAPSPPPPGWTRVIVDPDGMIRLPGRSQSFYPPQPGKTESIQLDEQTTLTLRHAEDGEIHGLVEAQLPDDAPGLEVDESRETFRGQVSVLQLNGQKVVNLGSLGTLIAPAVGGFDSYLMSPEKLLVLEGKSDGTVEVTTRTLGIKPNGDGFKGPVLPSDGMVEFAGRQYDVSRLQPGEEIKDNVSLEGTKFRLRVRKNHDGTVTIIGSERKNIWQQVWGLLSKIAPFLAAIPGLGLVAVAAKVLTVFNSVTDFVKSIKSGNVLGMFGSGFGALAGVSQGAFQAFASKVANLANVGQQVITTMKHGLGNGLLQVVSNGANLLSGIARAAGDMGQNLFQREAYEFAQNAGDVAGIASGTHALVVNGDPFPLVGEGARHLIINGTRPQQPTEPQTETQNPQEPLQSGTEVTSVRFDTPPTPETFGGAEDLGLIDDTLNSDFTVPPDTAVPTTGIYQVKEVQVAGVLGGHPGNVIGAWYSDGKPVREKYQNQEVVISYGPNGEVLRRVDQQVQSLPLMGAAFSMPLWRRQQLTEVAYSLIHEFGGGRPRPIRGGMAQPRLTYTGLADIADKLGNMRALTETEKVYVWGAIANLKGKPPGGVGVGFSGGYYTLDYSDARREVWDSDPGRQGDTPNHSVIDLRTDGFHGPLGNLDRDRAEVERMVRAKETHPVFGFNVGDYTATMRTAEANRDLIQHGFRGFARSWRRLFVVQ